ncbi:hypothetical protein [Paracoccus laeviglucosivorans]|uniref:Uncharacterized protein n=1 Tax=Paracoccus laeviglucosivorans TaxID=1197861 RepID=A0A521CRR5_9RHOB|nr:hypothetical protein [Paracoccus laeviglucosivorans]SMO62106.1 hypothetical protein SAMN06265221_10593 [Paracoccus laeviglucosivorans]
MRLPILVLLLSASPVLASSDDAWAQFQTDVETACTALAPEAGETTIEVNPFGSETYGAAIVTTTYEGGGADRSICIYDKHSKKAEMTAAFTPVDEEEAETAAPATN